LLRRLLVRAALPRDRKQNFFLTNRCLAWLLASAALFQGVHEVHDVLALRSRFSTDGLAVAFGVDESMLLRSGPQALGAVGISHHYVAHKIAFHINKSRSGA
jgi:hypothetical protein